MGNHFQEEFVEEYLETLHRLDRGDEYIKNNEIARQLKISPASVTEMIQRLADRGLVNYKRYYGVMLTEEGRKRAALIHNRHLMLELFLGNVMGMQGTELHDAACKLEHALTPELERLMTEIVRYQAPEELQLLDPSPLDIDPRGIQFGLLESLPPTTTGRVKALLFDAKTQPVLETLKLAPGKEITRSSSELTYILAGGDQITLDAHMARKVLVEY